MTTWDRIGVEIAFTTTPRLEDIDMLLVMGVEVIVGN
jgi:hypothetical protein